MNTLLLDSDWDLTLDANGNLAIAGTGSTVPSATPAYALAQDVASAVRTFQGELWYDTTLGVPYFQNILGQRPSLQFMKQAFVTQGMIVPDVGSITCYLTGPGANRAIGGQLQVANASGDVVSVAQTTNLRGVAPWWVQAIGANT